MNFLRLIDDKTTEIGARVPDFRLVDPSDNVLRLSDLRGAPAVLYFYPADGTEGCTQEACEFRDVYQDFKELDCAVYGVSPDSRESHESMINDNQLPFELCVDPDEMMMRSMESWESSSVMTLRANSGEVVAEASMKKIM